MATYNYNYNNRNNRNKKDDDWLSWVIIAILMFSGAWFVGVPWLVIKLFGSDKKNTANQAPPLNRTQAPPTYRSTPVYQARNYSTRSAYGTGSQNQTNRTVYYSRPDYSARQPQQAEGNAPHVQHAASRTVQKLTKTPKNNVGTVVGLIGLGILLAFTGGAILGAGLEDFVLSGSSLYTVFTGLGMLGGSAASILGAVSMGKAQKRYARYIAVIGSNEAVHVGTLAKKLGFEEKRVRKDLQHMIEKDYFGESAYINEELGYLFLNSKADDELREAKRLAEEKAEEARKNNQVPAKELSMYDSIIHQIRDVNDRIAHPVMSEKIYHIEEITRQIFTTVEKEPEKRNKIDRFLTYYLPTTLKLLESYAKLESTGSSGENIEESKASIEGAMDSIVMGFENLLDDLYDSDMVDIKSDIDVMKQMLNADGAKKDFVLDKRKEEPVDNRTQFQKDFGIYPGGSAAQAVQQQEQK